MMRKLFVIIMVVNLYLAMSNAWAGDWIRAGICLGAFLLMLMAALIKGLGDTAKRGDRVEPDREAGQ